MKRVTEVLVKGLATTVLIPRMLHQARRYSLPRFRKSQGFTSLTATESELLRDSLTYTRALFSRLPKYSHIVDFLNDTTKTVEEFESLVDYYDRRVLKLFSVRSAFHPVQIPTTRLCLRLYEDVYSALQEIASAHSLPFSFVYTAALTHGLLNLSPKLMQSKYRDGLERISERIKQVVDDGVVALATMKNIVGLPAHVRVAMLLSPGRVYTDDGINILAMSAGLVHSGQDRSMRWKYVADIVNRLVADGYLEIIDERGAFAKYVCIRKEEQTGGEECE